MLRESVFELKNKKVNEKKIICGFSKLPKDEKIRYIAGLSSQTQNIYQEFRDFEHRDPSKQRLFDEFSENTLTNFYMPYGVAPNFIIDGEIFHVPMVIEESSVVAAASKSAKFWSDKGGFHTEIVSSTKIGHVHFLWKGDYLKLIGLMPELRQKLFTGTQHITTNMQKRGGGILDIELLNKTDEIEDYYQLMARFETVDSMGANFINSCLEEFAMILRDFFRNHPAFDRTERDCNVIMSILSNFTPECLVNVWVETQVKNFSGVDERYTADEFTWRFEKAVQIAKSDTYRAVTHNKGIFNGIDAVALATGNDFRAIEASGHAYASRNGRYTSLTDIEITKDIFRYKLSVPLAMGTVGGLTALHPLSKRSLDILGNPDARQLMKIAASAGLANNFAAIKSLITKGIQKGHMKMHLLNILNHFKANDFEKIRAKEYFTDLKVSFQAVEDFLTSLRQPELATIKKNIS